MQVKIWLYVRGPSEGTTVYKLMETSFTPCAGMSVEDYAWKSAIQIEAVSFSTETPEELSAFMGHENHDTAAAFEQMIEVYRGHGWTVSSPA